MASTFFVMKMYFVWRTLREEETLFQNTLVFYDSHAPIAVCSRELAALQLRHAPQTSLACCIMAKTSLPFCEHEFSSSATVRRQLSASKYYFHLTTLYFKHLSSILCIVDNSFSQFIRFFFTAHACYQFQRKWNCGSHAAAGGDVSICHYWVGGCGCSGQSFFKSRIAGCFFAL